MGTGVLSGVWLLEVALPVCRHVRQVVQGAHLGGSRKAGKYTLIRCVAFSNWFLPARGRVPLARRSCPQAGLLRCR